MTTQDELLTVHCSQCSMPCRGTYSTVSDVDWQVLCMCPEWKLFDLDWTPEAERYFISMRQKLLDEATRSLRRATDILQLGRSTHEAYQKWIEGNPTAEHCAVLGIPKSPVLQGQVDFVVLEKEVAEHFAPDDSVEPQA